MGWEIDIHTTADGALANALYDMLQGASHSWLVLELVRKGQTFSIVGKTSGVRAPSELQPGPRAGFDEGLSCVQLLTKGFLAGWQARGRL